MSFFYFNYKEMMVYLPLQKEKLVKKIFLILLISIFILPTAVFAAPPTDDDVLQTTSAVLAAFGIIILASMFGENPEGVSADMDMNTGKSNIVFKDFNLDSYFKKLAEISGEDAGVSDMPSVKFNTMSGTIGVNDSGDVKCEMSFSGGNIKSLKFSTAGENLEYLTANGKDFSYLDLSAME